MAIQYPNFIGAPVQDSPINGLFENVLKGYKMQKEPAKMAEEQTQLQLANQLKQQEVENNPAKMDLERRYKEALISKANALAKNGGKTSTLKPNAAVANEEYIWNLEHPDGAQSPKESNEHLDRLKNALKIGQDATTANTERKKQIKNSAFFTAQPAKWKDEQLALAAGLGVPSSEATKAFIDEGKTFSDLAKEKGVDPKDVIPMYPIANENIKQLQIRSSLLGELHSFENNLKDIQGDYSRKFLKYSPKQIIDSLKNESPEIQGQILAARALQPEIAAIRARIALNGTIGIEALREIMDKSLGNMKIFEPLVSPEARNSMDKYLNSYIEDAFDSYKNKMQSYSQVQGTPQLSSNQSMPNSSQLSGALSNQNGQVSSAPTPQIPTWVRNSDDFKKWKSSLNPQQIEALRQAHIGK